MFSDFYGGACADAAMAQCYLAKAMPTVEITKDCHPVPLTILQGPPPPAKQYSQCSPPPVVKRAPGSPRGFVYIIHISLEFHQEFHHIMESYQF